MIPPRVSRRHIGVFLPGQRDNDTGRIEEVRLMKRTSMSSVVCAGFALALAGRVTAGSDVLRTVYFSAVDASGARVTDLTPADLTVKEGGKDRAIDAVGPATAPMQVFVIVDDGGTGAFQAAVARFIEATLGHAQYAISVMNPQPNKVANFSA